MQTDLFAVNAYDALLIPAKCISQCGSSEPSCLRDFLRVPKNYPAIGGNTSFNSKGDVVKLIMI